MLDSATQINCGTTEVSPTEVDTNQMSGVIYYSQQDSTSTT